MILVNLAETILSALYTTRPFKSASVIIFHQRVSIHERFRLSHGLCLFLALCVGIYSITATMAIHLVSHDHDEPHAATQHDHHSHSEDHDDPHEDSHSGDDGEHHHISCHGNVTMVSSDTYNHALFNRAMQFHLPARDEKCPTGPTFDLIKPPQVA